MASRSQNSAPGRVRKYGAPTETPKPGTTTRKRPKVGDKDPNYKPRKKTPAKKPAPKKPAPEKKKPSYNRRDWRGTKGAIEDAEK